MKYVTVITDNAPWPELAEVLADSIERHSDYPLVIRRMGEFPIPDIEHQNWYGKWFAAADELRETDKVVYLDADCVATENVDCLMDQQPKGYPLFPVHPNHPVNDHSEAYAKMIHAVGVQGVGEYVHAACFVADKSCAQWFDLAMRWAVELNRRGIIPPVGDETVTNLVRWRCGNTRYLPMIDPFWKNDHAGMVCVWHGCKEPMEARKLI